MRKATLIYGFAVGLVLAASVASAQEGWELTLWASADQAKNRVVVGQRSSAQDGVDGRYDVPARLGGSVNVYTELDGDAYWRDVQSLCGATERPCIRTWDVVVVTDGVGSDIGLEWSTTGLPKGASLRLTDLDSGETMDMRTPAAYSYKAEAERRFRISARLR